MVFTIVSVSQTAPGRYSVGVTYGGQNDQVSYIDYDDGDLETLTFEEEDRSSFPTIEIKLRH